MFWLLTYYLTFINTHLKWQRFSSKISSKTIEILVSWVTIHKWEEGFVWDNIQSLLSNAITFSCASQLLMNQWAAHVGACFSTSLLPLCFVQYDLMSLIRVSFMSQRVYFLGYKKICAVSSVSPLSHLNFEARILSNQTYNHYTINRKP
jgi:hypothetical protein